MKLWFHTELRFNFWGKRRYCMLHTNQIFTMLQLCIKINANYKEMSEYICLLNNSVKFSCCITWFWVSLKCYIAHLPCKQCYRLYISSDRWNDNAAIVKLVYSIYMYYIYYAHTKKFVSQRNLHHHSCITKDFKEM